MMSFGTFFSQLVSWIGQMGQWFYDLFYSEFTIGTITIRFMDIVLGSLIVLMALYLVKKFIPLT